MTKQQSKFQEIATQAAELEQSGYRDEAAHHWLKALAYSNSEINREWCSARARFCESRLWNVAA